MRFQLRAAFFILMSISAMLGCANGQSSRYPYYTGIKNPRLIDHGSDAASNDTEQPETSTTSEQAPGTVEDESRPAPQANRHGYPLPNITRQSGDFYRVQRGDTLYSIAWEYGHDVRDVAYWNRLRPPYTIYPRQKIRIKPTITTSVPKLVSKKTKPPAPVASKNKKKWASTKQKKPSSSGKISWQWPTKGKIIGEYSARESGKKGLDIAGKKGQPVYSAAGGEIVYSGSGLRGYGKLVIIKHNDTFFSAYAHNHRLFVKEDQRVKQGQHIADMGSSEAQQAMLHFEVRRNGKPVDPLRYLPRR